MSVALILCVITVGLALLFRRVFLRACSDLDADAEVQR
jgi:hypothetical protein